MVLAWWSPCITRPHCAADGEAGGGTEDVHFLKQFGLGEPCVICQDTSHDVGLPGRGAEDRQERRLPATECRPVSACTVLLHRGSTQSGCAIFPSVTLPITRRADRASRRRGAGRSPRPRSSRGSSAVPVPQIQEQIVEAIKVIPQEQMAERIVEQIVDVPMPQIPEQIVDVPVPQIMEETVEVAKLIPEERIQQRTLEETVNVPLLQIQEQIAAVV